MSKISRVLIFHHGHFSHVRQVSIACNNATVLSFKGKDINKAKIAMGRRRRRKGLGIDGE